MPLFTANTKLLFTGEYAVIFGAKAIVLPLVFSQKLLVEEAQGGNLIWESKENNKTWFKTVFSLSPGRKEDNIPGRQYIKRLLNAVFELNPSARKRFEGKKITIEADFPLRWGIGSSSTLTSLLARYANIDPFELNRKISQGSGYDVVAAEQHQSFLFQKTDDTYNVEKVILDYPFKDKLYFIYTGKKEDTAANLRKMNLNSNNTATEDIRRISAISEALVKVKDLDTFENLILEHEKIISNMTGQEIAASKYLPDFDGVVKSLGAWGGDFLLVTWRKSKEELQKYLEKNNMTTFFKWKEIVLK